MANNTERKELTPDIILESLSKVKETDLIIYDAGTYSVNERVREFANSLGIEIQANLYMYGLLKNADARYN